MARWRCCCQLCSSYFTMGVSQDGGHRDMTMTFQFMSIVTVTTSPKSSSSTGLSSLDYYRLQIDYYIISSSKDPQCAPSLAQHRPLRSTHLIRFIIRLGLYE
ncbi:hypothetical protein GDO78_000185 [Eleutherodactylus coqui]|uniref:Uncharacterized protein n=1 Tax=Eleutherodactylus coqui TaxID=57060 RepID=A0A8J6KH81_ELECQ|nr:hypothetical protein GDO78_000185 [Eleutherodactylus coqui]